MAGLDVSELRECEWTRERFVRAIADNTLSIAMFRHNKPANDSQSSERSERNRTIRARFVRRTYLLAGRTGANGRNGVSLDTVHSFAPFGWDVSFDPVMRTRHGMLDCRES